MKQISICRNCEYSGRESDEYPCETCHHYENFKKKKLLTNADRIRSMSDEELAEYIEPRWFDCSDFCEDFDAGCSYTCKHNKGAEFLLNWLKSHTTD